MARRRRRKKFWRDAALTLPKLPRLDLDSDTKRSIFIIFIFALGAISLLSLFDLAGGLGHYILSGMQFAFGWGKFLVPAVLLAIGFFMFSDRFEIRGANYLGLFLFVISFETFLHTFTGQALWQSAVREGAGGGYLGMQLLTILDKIMGFWASLVVIVCLLVVSVMLMFNTTLISMFGRDSWFAKLMFPINYLFSRIFRRREDEEEEESEEEQEEDDKEENEDEEKEEEKEENEEEEEEPEPEEEEEEEKPKKQRAAGTLAFAMNKQAPKQELDVWWKPTGVKIDLPFDLLSAKKGKPTSGDIKNNMEIIRHSLENFGIPVEMGDISVGPTVTQYTFKPAEGVKLSRITSLNNDLALALAAHPIRIEAPIPGKSLVGVEVPNQTKALVGLREIMEDKSYNERKCNLMVALGKDVAGKAWLYDIAKMPHLLVAGATNSGKSVCLNTIIISLMYQNNPDDLKFIMVDPKRVELPLYNNIPYLLTPVITDVAKTVNALKWCLNEMDRRYDILSQKGKKNIQTYNEMAKIKMPYIIFIIDELADLMVVAAKEVEGSIIRLAQMARAVGIHLVLATQRPSVDVITGLIKANMPARVAFSVASGIDSRTILDSLGAEKLLGRGDMLFTTAELSKPKRIQGAFVSELEIKKVTRFVKENGGQVDYIENITDKQKVSGMGASGLNIDSAGEDGDELISEAKEIVINMGKASASLLQRRLRIGYARAASILDSLEGMGVIGPVNGAKAREILVTKEQYEAMIDEQVSGVNLHNREEAVAPDEYLESEEENEDESEEEPNGEENFTDEPDDDAAENDENGDNEEEENEKPNKEEKDVKKSVRKNSRKSRSKKNEDDGGDADESGEDKNVERLLKEDKKMLDRFFSR